MEAAVARRCVGLMHLHQGDFIGAKANLAEALKTYDPERDRDAKFRFGADGPALATGFLSQAIWALGDVDRARALGEEALARADETAHAPTRALVYHNIALYQMLRGDSEAVRRIAEIPVELGREHGMALYLALGDVYANWARARPGDRESGMTRLGEALASYLGQGNKLFVPLFHGRLAEVEAEGDHAEAAWTRIDHTLALANETGEHWTDALLHGIRGRILLKRDPAATAPAEAFQAAIAVAQAQKTRSFELQAALALARLYQSTGRVVEAHAVLTPALEGFAPTPEMPEIAEAQALLAALGECAEVKSAAASRQRRLELQTRYSQAVMYSRGYASEESKTAFARALNLAGGAGDASGRYDAYYGLFIGGLVRGELGFARETAESFLRDAGNGGRMTEAAVARRSVGMARLYQGDPIGAEANLAEALRTYDPKRDRDAMFRFGVEPEPAQRASSRRHAGRWAMSNGRAR
jgi:predicted ATPase